MHHHAPCRNCPEGQVPYDKGSNAPEHFERTQLYSTGPSTFLHDRIRKQAKCDNTSKNNFSSDAVDLQASNKENTDDDGIVLPVLFVFRYPQNTTIVLQMLLTNNVCSE